MTVESAIQIFDNTRETYLSDLLTFLRFKTISTQPAHSGDMRACAAWLRGQFSLAGLEARVIPTAGHPVVLADTGTNKANADGPTILVYGHYDVQPEGDRTLWDSDAFEPTIRNGKIFARGSADDKGQLITHVAAMRCLKAAQTPPSARVKFIIEGEEEIGSPHLSAFVESHREDLACDYVVLSDTAKLNDTTPALAYTTRGLVYKEIILQGPSRDLHSGQYGGGVANPANVLAGIIASLHDERNRVTLPGFYDDVLELTDDERARLAEHGLSDTDLTAATGSSCPSGEIGFSTAERLGARPTLDVNGMVSGYIDDGAATIIPAHASAKISMRLVAHQDPAKISQAFDQAVLSACPPGVDLTITDHAGCPAYVGQTDSPGMRAAAGALAETYGNPPVFTREGGTLPILPMFQKVLGVDSIMLGFADPDCNLHSPNEFFRQSDFENGTRCVLRFLEAVGPETA